MFKRHRNPPMQFREKTCVRVHRYLGWKDTEIILPRGWRRNIHNDLFRSTRKDGKIYCPLKEKWLIAKPEEKVRQKFIATLVNEYGYTLDQMAQELELTGSKRRKIKSKKRTNLLISISHHRQNAMLFAHRTIF